MLATEKHEKISSVMSKIFNYLNSNLNLKNDLEEYYKTLGISKDNRKALSNSTINYIFERRIGREKKDIFDFALSGINDLREDEKKLILSLKHSVNGVFEVRKITRDKFELYNLINEKIYEVYPLEKMVKFRGLSVGHFLSARIVTMNGEYNLYHIVEHLNYTHRLQAYQIAITRLAQNPSLFCFDNEQNSQALKDSSRKIGEKFMNFFNTDIITTSNKHADDLIEMFNEYLETDEMPEKSAIDALINPVDEVKFFDMDNFQTTNDLFKAAKRGFSAQKQEYNISLVSGEGVGIIVIPFLDTFFKIFASDDYKSIEGYELCVKDFVENPKNPPIALYLAEEQNMDTFLPRINEILNTEFKSIHEIMQKYKNVYIENTICSATTTLFASKTFNSLLSNIDEREEHEIPKVQKVGRNDRCPCGSGLKYKKCCGREEFAGVQ